MKEIADAIIENDFTGFNGESVFKLSNGQVWQQSEYKYVYHYAHRPRAKVIEDGGRYSLHVSGMSESASVRQIRIVEEGVIVSDFKGFSGDANFKFQSGRTWVPAEYKYNYHYAYRPLGMVIDGLHGFQLIVNGMSDTLRVRRG